MIHPLLKLQVLMIKRSIIQRALQLTTFRGMLLTASILTFVAVALQVVKAQGIDDLASSGLASITNARASLAFGFLIACISTILLSSGNPLHFSQTEEQILFSAPLKRSHLVLFKFSGFLIGTCMSAAIVLLLTNPIPWSALASFLSIVLALTFIQLLSIGVRLQFVLWRQFNNPIRQYLAVATLVFITVISWFLLYGQRFLDGGNFNETVSSLLVGLLLLPFMPIAQLFSSAGYTGYGSILPLVVFELIIIFYYILIVDKKLVSSNSSHLIQPASESRPTEHFSTSTPGVSRIYFRIRERLVRIMFTVLYWGHN